MELNSRRFFTFPVLVGVLALCTNADAFVHGIVPSLRHSGHRHLASISRKTETQRFSSLRPKGGLTNLRASAPEFPVIDISPMSEEGKTSAKLRVAEEVRAACEEHGMFYVKGHGIPGCSARIPIAQHTCYAMSRANRDSRAGTSAWGRRSAALYCEIIDRAAVPAHFVPRQDLLPLFSQCTQALLRKARY
eukprot:1710169-Rhodomonas_salina.1